MVGSAPSLPLGDSHLGSRPAEGSPQHHPIRTQNKRDTHAQHAVPRTSPLHDLWASYRTQDDPPHNRSTRTRSRLAFSLPLIGTSLVSALNNSM